MGPTVAILCGRPSPLLPHDDTVAPASVSERVFLNAVCQRCSKEQKELDLWHKDGKISDMNHQGQSVVTTEDWCTVSLHSEDIIYAL